MAAFLKSDRPDEEPFLVGDNERPRKTHSRPKKFVADDLFI